LTAKGTVKLAAQVDPSSKKPIDE
jgi:hypothetical protein